MPREEKRGEENFPKGGNGDPPPDLEIPAWKAAKVQGLRRKIADHQAEINRWSLIPADRVTLEVRQKIKTATAEIRALETEILGLGVPL